MTAFLMIFRRFPKIFKIVPKARLSEVFPKMSEDFRRLPKTFEEDPKMFRWYTNYFKYNLRDKLGISEIIDIFTCEDIISSHVRISYRFYQFVTTRYTTDFYIIKMKSTYIWTRTEHKLFSLQEGLTLEASVLLWIVVYEQGLAMWLGMK